MESPARRSFGTPSATSANIVSSVAVAVFGLLSANNLLWLYAISVIVLARSAADERWRPPQGKSFSNVAKQLCLDLVFAVSIGFAHSQAFNDNFGWVLLVGAPFIVVIALIRSMGSPPQSMPGGLVNTGYVISSAVAPFAGSPAPDAFVVAVLTIHGLAVMRLTFLALAVGRRNGRPTARGDTYP